MDHHNVALASAKKFGSIGRAAYISVMALVWPAKIVVNLFLIVVIFLIGCIGIVGSFLQALAMYVMIFICYVAQLIWGFILA